MFESFFKAQSASDRPSRSAMQSELGKNEAFASLTEQAQKDVLDMLGKATEVDLFDFLHQIKAMTAATRDKVVGKLLHPEAATDDVQSKTYTVQAGDSLSKIAKAHDMSLKQMIAANPQVKNPDMIHPKEVINLA